MKTLVLFYSFTGNAKRLAEAFAQQESADIAEIRDARRPGTLKAYTLGCFAAMGGKPWPIEPLKADSAAFDRLALFFPVWAGNPPPAAYAMLRELPEGKRVLVTMVSGSGRSGCQKRLEAIIEAAGCVLEGFEDLRA